MAEAAGALVVAIVGAESTGKTTLARALAERLAAETSLAVAWVSEWLREWCDRAGRTPRADEQEAIARTQHERIDAAAAVHEVVICDTTALATAVYSRLLFGDRSLEPLAVALHRRAALTLLTATDLPWVADGLQRDGPHVRAPVDALLRELLLAHALPWTPVRGQGAARLEAALDAVAPLLRPRAARGGGLFTRLAARNAETAAQAWVCVRCDLPECEHRERARRSAPTGGGR